MYRLFLILIPLLALTSCTPHSRNHRKVKEIEFDNTYGLRTVARACLGYHAEGPSIRGERVSMEKMKEMLGFTDEDILVRMICGCSRLVPEGFPPCQKLVLCKVSVDYEIQPYKYCFTDKESNVFVRDGGGTYLLSDLIIPHANFLPGEAVNCLLATLDGKIAAAVHIVPNPLIGKNSEGQVVRLEVNGQSAKSYTLIGTGFAPREQCQSLSISGGEMVPGSFEATDEGVFMMHISPCVGRECGGIATIQILGESMYRPIEIHYPWGQEAICQKSSF